MIDLELIATIDLLEEMTRRFETAIFIGMACDSDTASDFCFSGNRFTCLGLLGVANRIVMQEVKAGRGDIHNIDNPLNERENDDDDTR